MTAFDEHRAAEMAGEHMACRHHVVLTGDAFAILVVDRVGTLFDGQLAQRLGLRHIRRDDGGQREQLEVSAAIASPSISFAPDVATITGSSTIFVASCAIRRSAITLMSSTLDTMPIFTATGGISSNTASICAASISGECS